jgi:hypothetical protein
MPRSERELGSISRLDPSGPRDGTCRGCAHELRLCDQKRRENIVPCLDIFDQLGVRRRNDYGLETAVAFRAAPKMKDVLLIEILGPIGGNQLIAALDAVYPEA